MHAHHPSLRPILTGTLTGLLLLLAVCMMPHPFRSVHATAAAATAPAPTVLPAAAQCSRPRPGPPFASCLAVAHLMLGGHPITVRVASDLTEQMRGLMGVTQLPEGTGMLFPVLTPQNSLARFERAVGIPTLLNPAPQIWMAGMQLPLDLIFVGRDGGIVDIRHDVPPCLPGQDCILYSARSPRSVLAILEVPAGTARTLDIVRGMRLTVAPARA